MSPRSEEFMDEAERCLRGARAQLAADLPSRAIGEAYYAMLYAARAALSEKERYAKTHRGTWTLFNETFVLGGRFDQTLAGQGPRLQAVREGTDYEARGASTDEAEAALATAGRFVRGVLAMLGE
jgi:uncharacterized protein (UPF0332 family)